MKFQELLAQKEWPFLSEITDEGDNRLRAVVCLGGHQPLPREILGKHVDEIMKTPVEYTTAPYYELSWDRYFAFMVRDEGAAVFRKEEEFAGHGVRYFKKSWLLAMVPELSNGAHEVHGKLEHYGLYCLNHIVDVLAYEEPLIRDLGHQTTNFRQPNSPVQTTPLSGGG